MTTAHPQKAWTGGTENWRLNSVQECDKINE
jgi:hypothetical protein